MKVFYTASYYGKEKYQRYYNMVLQALKQTGVEIISPELGNYKQVLSSSLRKKLKSEKRIHGEAIRKGILISDAVVIEASHEDFQLGFEAAFAVENKKPLLCLSTHENFSEKMKYRYLIGAKYNEYNIEEIVENFIEMIKKDQLSKRFNCFLTSSQITYLKKSAKLNNINISEYLRELIDKDRLP
jgi:predicted DNA binding CopG/RHH family protein